METINNTEVETVVLHGSHTSLRVHFAYGRIWTLGDLPECSIALDGAVQGPHLDNQRRVYSFDHHSGCIRLATLATCEQVEVAIGLGLNPHGFNVYVNDLDADTVLAVWLLLHSSEVTARTLRYRWDISTAVRCIGRTDSHGPVFPATDLHKALTPPRGAKQNLEMLQEMLQVIDTWRRGDLDPREEEPRRSEGYALIGRQWLSVSSMDGFRTLYARGYVAAALYEELADGSRLWTVGKKSDMVQLPLGPGDAPARTGQFTDTILGALARIECEKHGISPKETWGGGTSIGGGPRLERNGIKSGSFLSPEEIRQILQQYTPEMVELE